MPHLARGLEGALGVPSRQRDAHAPCEAVDLEPAAGEVVVLFRRVVDLHRVVVCCRARVRLKEFVGRLLLLLLLIIIIIIEEEAGLLRRQEG